MSTNNFKFENILVVIPDFKFDNRCMDEDCEHYESEGVNCEHVDTYYEYDTEGYNMYVKDMQEQLTKIGFTSRDSWNHDNNYNGYIIADWVIEDKEGNLKVLEVVIRNGYYDGANIDYTIIEGEYTGNKTLDKKFESQVKKLEKLLRKNGTELLKVGQFSNGEAVYQLKK
jgi:hypothetical protein